MFGIRRISNPVPHEFGRTGLGGVIPGGEGWGEVGVVRGRTVDPEKEVRSGPL